MFLGGWLKPPIRQVFKLALVPCEVSAGHGTLTNQTVAALGCAFPVVFSACFGQNDARFHQVIEDTWHPLSVYIFEESNMILRTAGYPGVSVKLNFNETRDINKSTCSIFHVPSFEAMFV